MNELFFEIPLSDALRSQLAKVPGAVEAIAEAIFVANSDAQLHEYVLAQFDVVPLTLLRDQTQIKPEESKSRLGGWFSGSHRDEPVLVSSLKVTVITPFQGDEQLWKCRPNKHFMRFPQGTVSAHDDSDVGELRFVVEHPSEAEPERFKRDIADTFKLIEDYIHNQTTEIAPFLSKELPEAVQKAVADRREKIGKHATVLKAIDIPLVRKPGKPQPTPALMRRRLVRPLSSPPANTQDAGIADVDYDFILSVIRHEGRTWEATPSAYAKLGEEELRSVILGHLNGHYQGDATGEAFRKLGKTDIRVEFDNRAAFVAECKLWEGAKQIAAAVDQLLGYLTWRDSKASLLIFNKAVAGFSAVQSQIPSIMRDHSQFKKDVDAKEPGEWRFQFSAPGDPGRCVTVHVFAFDIYVKPKRKDETAH